MDIKYIWNNGSTNQRADLLKSIYGDCWVMFHRDAEKDFDSIPYGVQCRLNRLVDVYKANKN